MGYRVSGVDGSIQELLVPTPVFDKEFCDGVDKKALITELQLRGWLEMPGNDGRPALQRLVGGKQSRYFIFQAPNLEDREKAMGGVGGVGGETETVTPIDSHSTHTPPIDKNGMGGDWVM